MAAVSCAAAAALLATGLAPTARAGICPNEARRVEQGARGLALPDCRAYELASPGSIVSAEARVARASVDGNAVTYYTRFPADDAEVSSYFYLANRGASGWSVRSAAPQDAPAASFVAACEQNVFFSPDLTTNIDEEGWASPGESAHCKRNGEVLVPGEPNPYRNVFLHDVGSDSNQLVNLTGEGVEPANAKFQDASDDFGTIVFSEEAELVPDAPPGYDYYVWHDGVVRLLTYLPDGSPVAGELAEASGHSGATPGSGFAPLTGAVSTDAGRIFFYAGGNLYVRERAAEPQSPVSGGECTEPALACTVEVDLSQGPGPSGGGVFWRATADGSRVLFTDQSKLTPDSTATAGAPDLYEYDATGKLTDLTVGAGEAANVRGVSGIAEDGSYVYFVADGVLAPGAAPGNCGGEASEQSCNLYVWHEGSIAFIATLLQEDSSAWQETGTPVHKPRQIAANVSPNGRFLAFASRQSLTGYDNHDAKEPANLDREIFLYEATAAGGAGALECVSCIPSGAPPDDGSVTIAAGGNYGPSAAGGNASWKVNAVTDGGRVFFTTAEGLVPKDVNLVADVYEYEHGEPHLISSGTYPGRSLFRDASPSGSDVFFTTAEGLTGADLDHDNTSLYDARVDGGFPEPVPAPSPCSDESCRDALAQPPATVLPATSSFAGEEGGRRKRHRHRRRHHHRRQHRRHRAHHRHRHGGGHRHRRGTHR